ncbi:MAG: 7-carboxy-7-deazaguanine synthase QueE [Pirellulales bacterium]|nr:7-carboxy-7-deazaguanine synthase QueE [Pirellulales bacterium]
MKIAEIYASVQGEGFLTGTPSIFVRTSGCNLRCTFCDTPYTSWTPEGEELSLDDILARVEPLTEQHAVITGGEPMLYAELVSLAAELRRRGKHITIETAGTLDLPIECDLMSISPKLSNSTPTAERDARWHVRHEHSRHVPEVIRRLTRDYAYQLKFVIDRPEDCDEVERYLEEFPAVDRRRVLLMPQGVDLPQLHARQLWLEPYAERHGYTYCPRRHIEWYGFVRGK